MSFLRKKTKLAFGDWVLIQEIKKPDFFCDTPTLIISKPKLVLFLKAEIYDNSLIGFEYIEKMIDFDGKTVNKTIYVENKDKMEILGFWKNRPTFSQLRKAYEFRLKIGLIKVIGGNYLSY